MSDTASFFEHEDELAKWRREGDAITEGERRAQRERQRAEGRAQRETSWSWRDDIAAEIDAGRESLLDVVGQAIGEEIADLRCELEKKMEVSLRIALLEQSGMLPKVCGTWDGDRTYDALSICTKDGGTFIAKKSAPTECPGPDWQILACRGSRGQIGPTGAIGPTGPPGPRGETGPVISGWSVDRKNFTVRPILDNGHGGFGPPLELRQLFEEFADQRDGTGVPEARAATKAVAAHRHVHNQPTLVALVHGSPPKPAEEEAPVE